MNKKGFTLIELLGVIALLAIISLVTLPPIINQINKKKDDLKKAMTETISSAAHLYVNNNKGEFLNQKKSCVKISSLVDNDYLDESIYSYKEYAIDLSEAYVKVGSFNENIEIILECTPEY